MPSENLAVTAAAPSSPGAELRRAREARGESVHEVAYALKLSPRQVEALESDDFDALPGMAFLRGFMRNYARHLGLDAAPLLDAVQRLAGSGSPDLSPIRNADGDLPSGDSRRSGSFPAGLVVLALLVMLAVGWYFDWFRTEGATTTETVLEPAPNLAPAPSQSLTSQSAIQLTPPQPIVIEPAAPAPLPPEAAPADGEAGAAAESQPVAVAVPGGEATPSATPTPATDAAASSPAPVVEIAAPATPEAPAATPAGSGQLNFRFAGDSWVEVRDASGTILHSGTNRAGSTRSVQGTAPFKLVVGNAANVSLEQDGKPVDLAAHVRGTVARLTLR